MRPDALRRPSLRRRLIATVLTLECALLAAMGGAALGYTWREQLHAFDLMLRGRADSLLGQVHDAEDVNDNVTISPAALDLHKGDVWMVRDTPPQRAKNGRVGDPDKGGRTIAKSSAWNAGVESALGEARKPRTFWMAGRQYRGMALDGVRQIDADDTSPGIARPVTIYYAVALQPVHEAVLRAARFLLIAGGLLLLITGVALAFLLRRGLAPLEQLSLAAGEMTPRHPRFRAPPGAMATRELAVLAGALESATERLEEAFLRQQEFVHDAAHELKTAVTIVKSSLQLLGSRPRTAREYSRGLETCLADCARMEELVQRMLQLARFEQEPAGGSARCDLAEVARDVAAQMETVARIRGVTIGVEGPSSAPAPMSEDACASLVANLLLNAAQHTPAGGLVTAAISECEGVGEGVALEVRDTGSGIAPEDLPHLFERFWRGDRSRARSTGGAGLGLAICKAIVDSCGGTIRIASRLGEGTRVTVTLPRAEEAKPAPRMAQVDEAAVRRG
jgi:signal transduction histidine kinase